MSEERKRELFLAERLAQQDLTSDDLMIVEALACRARKAGCDEVLNAAITVISALQGYYTGEPHHPEKGDR